MNSKAFTKITQTPISTIRYYEQIGLLTAPARQDNNYRDYTEDDVVRVRVIRFLAELEFPLTAIADFFADLKSGQTAHEQMAQLLTDKEAALDRRIEELLTLKSRLQDLRQNLVGAEDFLQTFKKLL